MATTALDELRAAYVPRDEALCKKMSRSIVPTGNLIFFGILWLSAGGGLAALPTLLVGYLTYWLVPARADGTRPVVVFVGFAVFIAASIAAWWIFARWVSARRGRARKLFREGQFIEARVQGARVVSGRRGAIGTAITITFPVERDTRTAGFFVRRIVKTVGHDGVLPILYLPDYEYCAAFALDGAIACARVAKIKPEISR